MLDDENDDQRRRLISHERIENNRRCYEYYAQTRDRNQRFSVYGTPEFHCQPPLSTSESLHDSL